MITFKNASKEGLHNPIFIGPPTPIEIIKAKSLLRYVEETYSDKEIANDMIDILIKHLQSIKK